MLRAALLTFTALLISCQNRQQDIRHDRNMETEQAIADQAQEPIVAEANRLDWWREARFGMFLHWGLYSVPAGQWGESKGHAEWILTTAQIPVDTYEQFVPQFNPVDFDAEAWVLMAKAAGMKYIVITSKHHDGFALYDSAVSDYDIMATPFKRDIMKELADACAKHDMKMCWYHSIMDWNHPDYLPRRGWEDRSAEGADFDRYVEYMRGQVTELLTNYGPIGVMWFDGEWESTWNHDYGQELYDLCRSLQPNVIVNNRVDVGRSGMAGMTKGAGFAGDFGTPEQEIPATGMPGVDWESCMTMNNHWGYNKNDFAYKSGTHLIQNLCDIASKGGNFLLNIGPTARGTFPQESIDRLAEMGIWMDQHGEAIHGTSASPFRSLAWGRCTMKAEGDNTVLYLHVFDWPKNERLVLPGIGNQVISAELLSASEHGIAAVPTNSDIVVRMLPNEAPNAHVSVIKVTIKGAPLIFEAPQIEAKSAQLLNELQVQIKTASAEMETRYTIDGSKPRITSPLYTGPITLTQSSQVRTRSFYQGEAVTPIAQRCFKKVEPRASVQILQRNPGLTQRVFLGGWGDGAELYKPDWESMPDFTKSTPTSEDVVPTIGLPKGPATAYEGRILQGFLEVPEDGLYTFELTSDDGSLLWLHNELLVDNDGLHGSATEVGHIALEQGFHPIRIEWFNKTGGASLDLKVGHNGKAASTVPASWLAH